MEELGDERSMTRSALTDITNTINASRRRLKRIFEIDDNRFVRLLSLDFDDITDDLSLKTGEPSTANLQHDGVHVQRRCANSTMHISHNKENICPSNGVSNIDIPESSTNRKRMFPFHYDIINLANSENSKQSNSNIEKDVVHVQSKCANSVRSGSGMIENICSDIPGIKIFYFVLIL
ncbi:hypothetical protein RIF29_14490 [Crotalaria pallida]|uniref:Uncharacterized protein n=1 Tax=Crotalaria pallida TaxID=3830 RepID=A0AAN9FDX7_CROPI